MSDPTEPTARELLDGIIAATPDPVLVRDIARAFARGIRDSFGADALQLIDRLNAKEEGDVCRSHDVCDANVFMDEAFQQVTGTQLSDSLPHVPPHLDALWSAAWDCAKREGFHRLGAVRGMPDIPVEDISVTHSLVRSEMAVTLPDLPEGPEGAYPLSVELDYWGRLPHLQVLCRNHGDEEGAPAVCVRYDKYGQVCEVLAGNVTLVKGGGGEFNARPTGCTGSTPWEIERDANPVCEAGDNLQMPSGQTATVARLRDRYDNNIETFRAYADTYGILARLEGYPGSDPRHQVYTSIEQAWEVNPLTAGTTNPADFSTVPEPKQPTNDNG